ncbi:UNVERIFIED_CONTAM: hypothetical protein Scaly_2680900 [Sesamum calycinum]|uniref:Uncharacterized protein n=1 Tax=Sesamum calycinum TaxID=2727403 RepID=A0AAW2J6R9_9LAMI
MVFDEIGLCYFASSHKGVPDNGTRSCPVDVGTSSYVYGGGGPYDYDELGLTDHFFNVVHAVDQPLWDSCNESQLGVIAELVNIKVDGHISERIYDRISLWGNRILPPDHTLPEDYYSTKKLDDVDLDYCKFCGDGRYKPARGRDPHLKKSPYAILRYLPLTPRLQRLYSSRAIVEHMIWHATHQTNERSMCHPSNAEAWKHFDRMDPDFVEEPRNVQLAFAQMVLRHTLWHVGVRTYDYGVWIFMMRVALMWIVNDLPAYGMVSGWSTTGVRGCPVFMDIKEKMKDNINAHRNLKIICNRPELELVERRPKVMPKAVYTLGEEQKRRVCEWILSLKFPDGYASNLACLLT